PTFASFRSTRFYERRKQRNISKGMILVPSSKARACGHKGYANFRGGMLVSIPMPDRHWQHRPARRDAFMGAIIHHMLDQAPAPVAPFSHAVETDGWFSSPGRYRRIRTTRTTR